MDPHGTGTVSPWIQHNAPRVDEAWAFAQALTTKQRQTIPDPPLQVENRKNKFKNAMRTYFKSTKDTQAENIFEHTNTWEEVRAEAQKALDLRYQQNGKKNFLRRSIRVVGDTASRLEFLTALIPSGDYMGVLCGGLKLVYNAANRMSAIRDLILGSLDSLSQPIEDTSPYLYTYSWSQDLLDRAHDLYVCILDAVEEIFSWISKHKGVFHGAVQIAKAIAQQDDYGKKLEAQITSCVEDRSKAFEKAVKACLSIEVHDMGRNVVRLGQGQERQDELLGEVKSIVKHIEASASLERVEAVLREYVKQLQPLIDAVNSSATKPQVPRTHVSVNIVQILAALHLAETLSQIDVVDYVVGTITAERRSVLMSAGLLPHDAEEQVASALQDSRFSTWLHSMRSEVLVVSNMDGDMLQENPSSPLSYLCSALLKSLAPTEHIFPIAFFCRNHCDPQDKLYGVSGMMRSLIAQLALTLSESRILDLSWLTEDDLHSIATQDLRILCRLYEQLIAHVPSGIVICMIDGVDFFAQGAYASWLNEIMGSFNGLMGYVGSRKPGLVFKMLVTSHRGASLARQWFPYRVELPILKNESMDGFGIGGGAEMQSIF